MSLRTLLFAVFLLQICCAAGLLQIGRHIPGFKGLRWFGYAYACAPLALGLGVLIPNSPWLPHLVVGARACMMLSAVLMTQGIAEFVAPASNLLTWGLGFLALFTLADWCSVSHPALAVEVFCVAFAVQLFIGVMVLLSHAGADGRFIKRVTAALLAFMGLLCLTRGLLAPWRVLSNNLLSSDGFRFDGLLAFMVTSVGMAFGFVGMVTSQLRHQLQLQARTDALTGVLNRRVLDSIAMEVIASCRARGVGLAVIVLDLDHFKKLNDRHGHAGGDAVLVASAQLLTKGLRAGDTLARLGGEEFVVLLPDRAADQAYEIAERLRRRFETLAIDFENELLSVSASFGVAVLGGRADTWVDLLRRADHALYQAKQAGRNCTRGEGCPATTLALPTLPAAMGASRPWPAALERG